MGIKALLNHFGDSGHHPLVAELHCMYGSLISEHTTTSFNMYGAGGAMNATNFNYINLAKKNLEKAKRLASKIMGKYSKRRRSNVAVVIVRIDFICSFFFYCLLLNHIFVLKKMFLLIQ